MDLIYTNNERHEMGYLDGFDLDLEDSDERHDFQLTVPISTWSFLKKGNFIYSRERPELGGMITKMKRNTSKNTITWYGYTWLGILTKKVIMPRYGQSYLSFSANGSVPLTKVAETALSMSDMLAETRYDLSTKENAFYSVKNLTNDELKPNNLYSQGYYSFVRYCNLLDGLSDLYSMAGHVLQCFYDRSIGRVVLYGDAATILDTADEFSSYQYTLDIEKEFIPVNHIVALGSGELSNRTVYHILLKRDDSIVCESNSAYLSHTYTERFKLGYYVGPDEIVEVYDYAGSEGASNLTRSAIKKMEEYRSNTKAEIDLSGARLNVGDMVKSKDELTGIEITKKVNGIVLKATEQSNIISYKFGG